MPLGLSNKDGCIFFIKIVSHTFPDNKSHKRIIYDWEIHKGTLEKKLNKSYSHFSAGLLK
jgi:hypothetical protein